MVTAEQRLTVDYPVTILRRPSGKMLKPRDVDPLRAMVAQQLQALLAGGEDTDPIGDLDEMTLALLQAMDELDAEAAAEGRAWTPAQAAKHPRDPVTGKFIAVVDLLKAAIKAHKAGSGKHPFDEFSREQLRKAAKARGIALKKGESKESIAAKLLADLGGPPKADPDAVKAPSWAEGQGIKLDPAFKMDPSPLAGGKLESQVVDLFPASKPTSKPSTAADVKAGDFSGLKRVGPQAGSNPGGVFEAPDGSRWYVKAQKSQAHAKNEATASVLYREAGIDVPTVHCGSGLAELGNGPQTATRMVDGAHSDLSAQLNDPAYVAAVRHGFAVDAWLGNWDAVGASLDNIVTADSKPHRVDVGGSLLFRAQGAPKGDAFGKSVLEWATLRDPSKAPQAAQFFADITPDQLKGSAALVEKIKPARIRQLVDDPDLAQLLIDRRKDLLARAKKIKVPDFGTRLAKAAADAKSLESARIRLVYPGPGSMAGITLEGDVPPLWTTDEFDNTVEALSGYRGSDYIGINDSLRMNLTPDSDTKWRIESIDRAMSAATLQEDVVVYRGIHSPDTVFKGAWANSASKVGLTWTDSAFTSTTADRRVSLDGFTDKSTESALMRLIVPRGVAAVRLSDMAPSDRPPMSISEEAELLLQRGLTFRVVADHGYDGTTKIRLIDVEVVPV